MNAPLSRPTPDQLRRQQKIVRAVILIVGAFVMLCFLFADPVLRSFRKHDIENSPTYTATATIVTLVPLPVHEEGNNRPSSPLVSVRFQGGVHTAANVIHLEQLREGQPARIHYRVGRSGTISVDTVEPLATAE